MSGTWATGCACSGFSTLSYMNETVYGLSWRNLVFPRRNTCHTRNQVHAGLSTIHKGILSLISEAFNILLGNMNGRIFISFLTMYVHGKIYT